MHLSWRDLSDLSPFTSVTPEITDKSFRFNTAECPVSGWQRKSFFVVACGGAKKIAANSPTRAA